MFEMRLGLALGKTVGEVRALPYPEFKNWRLMYILEPWGWMNEEVGVARILAMLFNTHVGDEAKAKSPEEYIRQMSASILQHLSESQEEEDFENLSIEERRAWYIQQFKRTFGV